MANDEAVMFSIGALEGWITKADELINRLELPGISNADNMIQNLHLIEAAYLEQIRTIDNFRRAIQNLRSQLDVTSNL
jgi:hypothetical protein